jgi:hypothetical protein
MGCAGKGDPVSWIIGTFLAFGNYVGRVRFGQIAGMVLNTGYRALEVILLQHHACKGLFPFWACDSISATDGCIISMPGTKAEILRRKAGVTIFP